MKLRGLFKGLLLLIIMIAVWAVVVFVIITAVLGVQTELLLDGDYILVGMNAFFSAIFAPMFIVEIPVSFAMARVLKLDGIAAKYSSQARWIRKNWFIVILVALLSVALMTFNFTGVKENEIVKYNLLNLTGKSYSLEKADKIKAGFDSDGEFYYNVIIDDEEFELTSFWCSTTHDDFEAELWSEYEYIDKMIFTLNPDVEKKASLKNIDEYGYDEKHSLEKIINYMGES